MIREARESDLPAILDIYNDAIVHTTAVYDEVPHTLEMRREWYRQRIASGFPVFVFETETEGAVAGFASYGPFRPWSAYRYTAEHSVYVRADCRGRGVGRALLERVISHATERSFAVLVGGIDESNAASIRLHEAFGFAHSGTIRKAGYKFGRWLNLAFYQLELPGPSPETLEANRSNGSGR